MNIALDLRLIDTRTLEVVDVISYQKQIIGREVRAGVFDFFDDTLFDIAAGERALEPVQLAVRAGVERAVVEVMSRFYRVRDSSVCAAAIARRRRPDGPGGSQRRTSTQSAEPVASRSSNRAARPDAWHARRDDNITGIRGRS